MADYTTGDGPVTVTNAAEKESDYGQGDRGTVARWLAEIALYDGQYKNWQERAGKIVKRYRDERAESDNSRKLNILWSNIQTLQPAIYARCPAPDVQRRYKDRDPVGRMAAEVLERGLAYSIDTGDLDGVLKQCRDDYLLIGRAQVWVRYEFEAGEILPGTDLPSVEDEKAPTDYVYWKDFGHSVRRTWAEVRQSGAVWRRSYLTRKQLVTKFGEEIGKKVPLDTRPPSMDEQQAAKHNQAFKTACVYEIWDADSRRVLWIAKGYADQPLKVSGPPINFDGFFPCPEPLYGCITTDSLIPMPDYAQYQDQAIELDILTERISLLVTTVRVAGLYNGAIKENLGTALQLNGMVSSQPENVLIPVDDWAMYAEKGGMKGQIDWLPLEMIIVALEKLYEAREAVKQSLYEISGVSDIVRGQGAVGPNPTATEQRIKGQFATMRLDDRQRAVARFSREIIRLVAEVIAEQFSAETLKAMTGIDMPDTEAERQMMVAANQPPPPPMMGHNGGPPLNGAPPQPAAMPVQAPGALPGAPGSQTPPMAAPNAAPPGVPQVANAMPGPGMPPPAAPPKPETAVPPASWESVLALLHDDLQRGFRIDIETDSTIAVDEEAEKKSAIEFLGAVTPFVQQMTVAATAMPSELPLLGELLMFVVRRFKAGRNLENTFEQTIENMREMAKMPRPDPHMAELKLEAAKTQQTLQLKAADAHATQQLDAQKAISTAQLADKQSQHAMAIKNAELAAEQQRKDMELKAEQQRKDAELAHEFAMAQAQHGLARDQMQSDHNLKRAQMGHDHALKKDEAAMSFDLKAHGQQADHQLKRQGQQADIGLKQQASQANIAIKGDAAAAKAQQSGAPAAPATAPALRSQAAQSAQTIGGKIDELSGVVKELAALTASVVQVQQQMAMIAAQPPPEQSKRIHLIRGKDGRIADATVTVGNA